MTCIIGLESNGKVFIGADSGVTCGNSISPLSWPKVFLKGDFLIGHAWRIRPAQIIQHHLEVREKYSGESDDHYIVCGFVDGVRRCLRDYGWAAIEDNRQSGPYCLFGYNGHLYELAYEYEVVTYNRPFAAIGCGEEYALGVMEVLGNIDPEERITKSLEVSEKFSAGVLGPFTILSI